MIKIVCFLLFTIYCYLILFHSSKLFLGVGKNTKKINIAVIINSFTLGMILLFDNVIYEWLLMIVYFIFICLQLKLIYNDEWIKNIFVTLCFGVNFFAIRLIYMCIYSLIINTTVYQVSKNFEIMIIITILSLITVSIYLLPFIILTPIKYIHMIIAEKNNLKFCISILSSMYLFLMLLMKYLYVDKASYLMIIFCLNASICSIIEFFVIMLYSYLFSKLQLYVVKAENIEKEIKEDEIVLKKLEDEANYDYFTSCLKRDSVYKKIDSILEGIPFFCIVFIDIDGLKITNDIYGHDEGDFYIKAVAEILNSEFVGKVIGRIGGDEFLVVLEHTDIYATMKCVIRCFERVENLSKIFNKPYSTSISYGVIEVSPDNKLSRDEIIKLADEQMYNFKKLRKKNRK